MNDTDQSAPLTDSERFELNAWRSLEEIRQNAEKNRIAHEAKIAIMNAHVSQAIRESNHIIFNSPYTLIPASEPDESIPNMKAALITMAFIAAIGTALHVIWAVIK